MSEHIESMKTTLRETADAPIWWGGWGGVTCGWQKPECFEAEMDHDWEHGGKDDYATRDEFVDAVIGEGVWPRSVYEVAHYDDEFDMKCDQCDTPVSDIIGWAVEALSSLRLEAERALRDERERPFADTAPDPDAISTSLLREWEVHLQAESVRTFSEEDLIDTSNLVDGGLVRTLGDIDVEVSYEFTAVVLAVSAQDAAGLAVQCAAGDASVISVKRYR